MSSALKLVQQPELIFGIAGPIGVDVDEITNSLANCLKSVRYDAHVIKLTNEMLNFSVDVAEVEGKDFFHEIRFKMDYANALCRKYKTGDALARIAIRAITHKRLDLTAGKEGVIPERVAYVVRQFKRPEEIALLRHVYGRQFILISAYGSERDRKRLIEAKLRRSLVSSDRIGDMADQLIAWDASEDETDGQQLRDTFHLADVFIDGIDRRIMDAKVNRFIQAFFGKTDIAPSKDEYGMYAAKSASLRSSDLSRQVGAAIFTDSGELITQGCNEVPKALGGTYWDLEDPDYRDVRLGHDPNELLKKELLLDLFTRLKNHDLLSETALSHGSPAQILEAVTRRPKADEPKGVGALVGSSVMDLTEYGRVVHAEMCAICDAARLGRSIKGATLYCTTFPCHNCTKHVLAAGIKRVVYMEPYPKSKAKDLHENEIEIEVESDSKVSFVPFLGISPFRYRDIFQKGKRKRPDGTARRWYDEGDEERPMLEVVYPSYPEVENAALLPLIGSLEQPDSHSTSLGDQHNPVS